MRSRRHPRFGDRESAPNSASGRDSVIVLEMLERLYSSPTLRREHRSNRRRTSIVEQRPVLQLPTPFPGEGLADDAPQADPTKDKVQRGVVVVDFYI